MPRGISTPKFKVLDETAADSVPDMPMDAVDVPMVPPVFSAMVPVVPIREIEETKELIEGVRQLTEYLPEAEADMVREIAQMLEVPEWQVIAGYVMRCREMGVLQSPIILAEWQDSRSPRSSRGCRLCEKVFQPTHWGQPYCSPECGTEGEKRGLNK